VSFVARGSRRQAAAETSEPWTGRAGVQTGPDEAERGDRRAISAPVELGQVKRAVDLDGPPLSGASFTFP
jgi:hypothetical protein